LTARDTSSALQQSDVSGVPGRSAEAPAWVETATPWSAFWRGLLVTLSAPGLTLFCTSIGFGSLARDLGYSLGHAFFMTTTLYALPAQVMLIDQLARGASIAAAAFAVTLTAVRLLPMTVTLLPLIKGPERFRLVHLAAGHVMAITVWLEGSRRLPLLPQHLRLAHFFGIGGGMFLSTCLGTVTGYLLALVVPPALLAALLFMTPVYFLLSLAVGARMPMDWIAICLGVVLGPILFQLAPGPDLMLTGLIGGTIAYLIQKRSR
jgi:predicted branched-subunit amino acid permease